MAARCFNDSCSVEWSEVTTSEGDKFQADVALATNGSISCSDGLLVDLVNTSTAQPGTRNILFRDPDDGKLHASLPQIITQDFEDANRVAMPADRDTTAGLYATTNTHTYTNSSGFEQLVIVTGELFYNYAVLRETSSVSATGLQRVTDFQTSATVANATQETLVPYNASVTSLVQYGISNAPSLTARRLSFGVSGVKNGTGADSYQLGLERVQFHFAIPVGSGQNLQVNSTWAYQGNDQTINVIAYGSAPLDNLGVYIKNGRFVAIPLEVA